MMTTYTRRAPGQEYLKATLGELVKEVVEQKDLVLEINPQKVHTLSLCQQIKASVLTCIRIKFRAVNCSRFEEDIKVFKQRQWLCSP